MPFADSKDKKKVVMATKKRKEALKSFLTCTCKAEIDAFESAKEIAKELRMKAKKVKGIKDKVVAAQKEAKKAYGLVRTCMRKKYFKKSGEQPGKGRKKPGKGGRKSRKGARKSRKGARKSRKGVRKSRKGRRKSRKGARKSRK